MVSAQDFSDHSCFEGAWVCTFQSHNLQTHPQASWGSRELASSPCSPSFPSPSRCSRKITPLPSCTQHTTQRSLCKQTLGTGHLECHPWARSFQSLTKTGCHATHPHSMQRVPQCASPRPVTVRLTQSGPGCSVYSCLLGARCQFSQGVWADLQISCHEPTSFPL